MTKTDPVIHDLAVAMATVFLSKGTFKTSSKSAAEQFYRDYLMATEQLSAVDTEELSKPRHRVRPKPVS